MMAARAVATATLGFGLVSIPVKAYVAASEETVRFNMLDPKRKQRVKQRLVDSEGEPITREHTYKGYEFSKGQYVTFEADELKRLRPPSEKRIEVKQFVPRESVSPTLLAKSYYLAPDKGGDRGLRLLSDTMREAGVVAIAQWTNRDREHLVAVEPLDDGGLILRQLYYSHEVRPYAEIADKLANVEVSDAERTMARRLVDELTGDFEHDVFVDGYHERVKAAVEEKVAGKAVTFSEEASPTNVIDLVEALKRSLGDKAEPAEAEAPAPKPKRAAKRKPTAKPGTRKAKPPAEPKQGALLGT